MEYLRQILSKINESLSELCLKLKSYKQEDLGFIRLLRNLKVISFLLSFPLAIFLSSHLLFRLTPVFHNIMGVINPVEINDSIKLPMNRKDPGSLKMEETRIKNLEKALKRYDNTQPYLVVNTTSNHFKLYNRGKIVREGMCSTGSYILLDAGDEKKWKFETPKGLFRIQGKTESPVWKKPDWAFIEEGLPVPSSSSHLRYEYGVLGDYALSIGNGYLIHGTLYKRLLGMPVTHGCVRMDDEDLQVVFNTLRVGSKVFIF